MRLPQPTLRLCIAANFQQNIQRPLSGDLPAVTCGAREPRLRKSFAKITRIEESDERRSQRVHISRIHDCRCVVCQFPERSLRGCDHGVPRMHPGPAEINVLGAVQVARRCGRSLWA